ncbi:D-glycero-alpha-D-manno-heptose-1,7-bisphosphate 7-phosphatase [Chloroflexota bacterium]
MNKAVFLDRDDTIIKDVGHPHKREQVTFLSGAYRAISLLNTNGYKVVIVTNQAGIAKGYFTEETVREFNDYLIEEMKKQNAVIDAIYYCPHHVEAVIEEYRKDCYNRKPNPGMLEEAASVMDIDLEYSYLIGDKVSDIDAGRRAGCRTILINSNGSKDETECDHISSSLYEAVTWLVNNGSHDK